MNESSNRQDTINEEPELREYSEAREMLVDKPIREAKARKEGWQEGFEGERKHVRWEVVTCLNESGVPIDAIVEITGLSPEEVRDIIGR